MTKFIRNLNAFFPYFDRNLSLRIIVHQINLIVQMDFLIYLQKLGTDCLGLVNSYYQDPNRAHCFLLHHMVTSL